MGRAPAECMFHVKVHIFELASGEVSERCKIAGKARSSLIPPDSATSSERFLNFDRGPAGRSPHVTDSSPDLPVFVLSKCD